MTEPSSSTGKVQYRSKKSKKTALPKKKTATSWVSSTDVASKTEHIDANKNEINTEPEAKQIELPFHQLDDEDTVLNGSNLKNNEGRKSVDISVSVKRSISPIVIPTSKKKQSEQMKKVLRKRQKDAQTPDVSETRYEYTFKHTKVYPPTMLPAARNSNILKKPSKKKTTKTKATDLTVKSDVVPIEDRNTPQTPKTPEPSLEPSVDYEVILLDKPLFQPGFRPSKSARAPLIFWKQHSNSMSHIQQQQVVLEQRQQEFYDHQIMLQNIHHKLMNPPEVQEAEKETTGTVDLDEIMANSQAQRRFDVTPLDIPAPRSPTTAWSPYNSSPSTPMSTRPSSRRYASLQNSPATPTTPVSPSKMYQETHNADTVLNEYRWRYHKFTSMRDMHKPLRKDVAPEPEKQVSPPTELFTPKEGWTASSNYGRRPSQAAVAKSVQGDFWNIRGSSIDIAEVSPTNMIQREKPFFTRQRPMSASASVRRKR
jgi:hypothetical protein